MTMTHESYQQYWADWQSGSPPVDPRGPHHGLLDPEFIGLCELAERVHAHVELDVSVHAYGEEGREYRQIVCLMVRPDDMEQTYPRVTVRFELGDTLRSMAERARRELEAKL